MSILGVILLPFTFLYSLGIRLRNHLFDIGYSRILNFEIPIVLVGNLSAGGSGKTPMVEFLVEMLKEDYKLAILSRGYKRKTSGFRLASKDDTALTIGDEPFQYYNKWKEKVNVSVGEDRAEAIPKIIFERPETELIVMDDGYQHRTVSPKFKILLTDYKRPFYHDYLLPSGRLREPRKEAGRADVIVITKCPQDLSGDRMDAVKVKVLRYCKHKIPVFFSYVQYEEPRSLFPDSQQVEINNVIAVSGISNPIPFLDFINSKWNLLGSIEFSDHHQYKSSSIEKIRSLHNNHLDKSPVILTTEKDAANLRSMKVPVEIKELPIFVLPIKTCFIENGSKFEALIRGSIES